MAAFKLPRLKSSLAIVNGQGRPTDFFLRLFNIDFAQRLETIISEQQAIIDAIQAAQDAADAAQETADLALEQSEAGARYTRLDAGAGAATALSTVNFVTIGSRLQLSGQLIGGTLDANSDWIGQAEFFEDDGATTNSLGVVPITTTSSGLNIGAEWVADDSTPFDFDVVAGLFGTIEYRVTVTRTGGSNYVAGASINSILTITPEAT